MSSGTLNTLSFLQYLKESAATKRSATIEGTTSDPFTKPHNYGFWYNPETKLFYHTSTFAHNSAAELILQSLGVKDKKLSYNRLLILRGWVRGILHEKTITLEGKTESIRHLLKGYAGKMANMEYGLFFEYVDLPSHSRTLSFPYQKWLDKKVFYNVITIISEAHEYYAIMEVQRRINSISDQTFYRQKNKK